jgi:MerR family transcriptional regulator, light-induced transcriptional regulator
MSPYLTRFSIRDLEEFSGVKAHTIRIWERRYGILAPDRTGTNIRTYGVDELKAILNVAYLNRNGVKISKIASLSVVDREKRVKEVADTGRDNGDQVDALKLAMVGYDTALFGSISQKFLKSHGFRALIERLYVPLLERIGLLWQSNAICPAQEHFVSNLVRQKLVAAIDLLGNLTAVDDPIYVLYLPENEIHELGLLYTHYLLRTTQQRVIYLGASVPLQDLAQVAEQFPGTLEFISIFTAFPQSDDLAAYLAKLRLAMPSDRIRFRFTGSRVVSAGKHDTDPGIRLIPHFKDLVASLM